MIPQRARCKLLGTFSFPARSVSDRQIGGRHRLPNLPERPAGSARRSQSEDVRVDHGGLDVGVAEQFLHGADVGAGLQQIRGEGVTQPVMVQRFVDWIEVRVLLRLRDTALGPHRRRL